MSRILVEVIGPPYGEAVTRAAAIINRLDESPLPVPRLLHGEGPAAWSLVAEAARLNIGTRIGLEDTLLDRDGRLARSNADLVRLALTA
jgi:uncharacterized protein (DUF849 family)